MMVVCVAAAGSSVLLLLATSLHCALLIPHSEVRKPSLSILDEMGRVARIETRKSIVINFMSTSS